VGVMEELIELLNLGEKQKEKEKLDYLTRIIV
jgi:hypothetical protein